MDHSFARWLCFAMDTLLVTPQALPSAFLCQALLEDVRFGDPGRQHMALETSWPEPVGLSVAVPQASQAMIETH